MWKEGRKADREGGQELRGRQGGKARGRDAGRKGMGQ